VFRTLFPSIGHVWCANGKTSDAKDARIGVATTWIFTNCPGLFKVFRTLFPSIGHVWCANGKTSDAKDARIGVATTWIRPTQLVNIMFAKKLSRLRNRYLGRLAPRLQYPPTFLVGA